MHTARNAVIVSLLVAMFGCGDKASSAAGSASASAAPKGKAGSVSVITGDQKDEVNFDLGFVERTQMRTSVTLLANCSTLTCENVGDFKTFKSQCPKGQRVEIWLEDAKEGTPIPTGALGKPRVWVRWEQNPDVQDDIFFDKGLEITKADATTVAGTFSIAFEKPDPGATDLMGQKGGSLKGNFEAKLCPPR